jgi:pyruvate dehydrogenase E1 component
MGEAGEAMNISHQQKKMDTRRSAASATASSLPVPDDKLEELPYLKFAEGLARVQVHARAAHGLGGFLPQRRTQGRAAGNPAAVGLRALLKALRRRARDLDHDGLRAHLNTLLKDKKIGKRVVPIVPDESRTFGMEGMFRQVGIWNQEGQNYVPEDHDQLMFYKESKTGQVLQEGINEAGAMATGSPPPPPTACTTCR